ncbi:MAG: MacB family efflux pump subunit [Campylobacteraceae bacterium]|jgi:macrolide transport system ATP-binding/permease protein|nr:MacB family efflux pump subunit [Campylobacteraceae bacterium]
MSLIELSHVHRHFGSGENQITVLNDINLRIDEGEFVAIIGASGSGKTTLMNIIGCLDKSTSGIYRFDSKNISNLNRNELSELKRESFGFIFQNYHLINSLTAIENVEVPSIYAFSSKQERHKRAAEILGSLGLGERLYFYPAQLSGGQQQRVSIARALMNGGKIILADEPTGALDSKSGEDVMNLLLNLSKLGHTVILITHDAKVAAHAHRIIEIKDGKILSNSTPEQTKNSDSDKNIIIKQPFRQKKPAKMPFNLFMYEIAEAVSMAVSSLKINIFRTILTLLGIVIGVASVIAMLAIGDGAKKEVLNSISSMGTNMIMVFPGMPNSRHGGGSIETLVLSDVDAINALPNIVAAMPEARRSVTLRFNNNDRSTTLNANSWAYPHVREWSVAKGVFFTKEDEQNYAKVIVLGDSVARELFAGVEPVGQYVLVNNIMFQVIGVMSKKGASAMGDDEDDVVFTPYSTGNLHVIGQKYLRNIRIGVKDTNKITQTEENIRELLIKRHDIEDFRVLNMSSLIDSMEQTQNTFTILLGSIAAISLLVGGIGVMNIMLVSVTERTKEIGIRVATGARSRNIMQQFLIEALIVSAFGGLIGIFVGITASFIIEYFGMPVVYSIPPIMLAFSCAFFTGLIFGFLPARKAAGLNPVAALSGE